jgi:hypothetical protein
MSIDRGFFLKIIKPQRSEFLTAVSQYGQSRAE